MAATYCKLLYQLLHSISADSLPGSIDDFCKDVEFPAITEPRPEDKSSTLTKAYQRPMQLQVQAQETSTSSHNNNTFNPAGQIQQDSVPDPGIGNWFTSIFDTLKKLIGSNLRNGDPS